MRGKERRCSKKKGKFRRCSKKRCARRDAYAPWTHAPFPGKPSSTCPRKNNTLSCLPLCVCVCVRACLRACLLSDCLAFFDVWGGVLAGNARTPRARPSTFEVIGAVIGG